MVMPSIPSYLNEPKGLQYDVTISYDHHCCWDAVSVFLAYKNLINDYQYILLSFFITVTNGNWCAIGLRNTSCLCNINLS